MKSGSVLRDRTRKAMILLYVAAAACALGGNVIRAPQLAVAPGQGGVQLSITVDNDEAVWAISFAARYDTALTFQGITLGAVLGPAGADAEWFEAIEGPEYFGAAVIVDFEEPYAERTLPAGTGQEAFVVTFDVPQGGTCGDMYIIDLRSDLGDPPVKPVFTVVPAEGDKITETVVPALADGAISIDLAPAIDSIDPTFSGKDERKGVTITGSGFSDDTQVRIGGQSLLNRVVESPTRITGNAPKHDPGVVDVQVENPCGSDTLVDGFEYLPEPPPVPTAVTPRFGRAAGGTSIVIEGQNFTPSTSILFDSTPLQNQTFVSETEIHGVTGPHAEGPVDVVAIDGPNSGTLPDGFTYVGPPTVESIQPNQGDGGEVVTVRGTNFTGPEDKQFSLVIDFTVTIDPQDITVISSTELTFLMPECGGAQGWRSLALQTVGGVLSVEEAYFCGTPGTTFRRGDANCDGRHDLADAIAILGYLFSGKQVNCLDALDTNDTGSIDVADAIYLLGYFFAQGSPPPPPLFDLGTDPTSDSLDCAQQCGE